MTQNCLCRCGCGIALFVSERQPPFICQYCIPHYEKEQMETEEVKKHKQYITPGCSCEQCLARQEKRNKAKREWRWRQEEKARAKNLDAQPLIDLLYEKVDTRSSLGRKLRYWRTHGVDPYTADKFCCEMGYHPYEVFGDEWFKGVFVED